MANPARVRVELKKLPSNASYEQEEKAFKMMFSIFKRRVNESGILTECKSRQYYETPGEKKRRKRREAVLQRRKEAGLHTRLRERFGSGE